MRRKARQATKAENRPRFWGRHAVAAALANPDRGIVRIWATREAAGQLDIGADIPVTFADVADLGRLVPRDAPHQGVVAEVEQVGEQDIVQPLDQAEDRRPLLVLDQVTDPHNVGAILRSAAAFNALGIVTQDRHAPGESGALAKAASGALETVPWARGEMIVDVANGFIEAVHVNTWGIEAQGLALDTLTKKYGPPARSRSEKIKGLRSRWQNSNNATL